MINVGHHLLHHRIDREKRRNWSEKKNQRSKLHVTRIQFITEEKGRKTAAVIDLRVHRALWEDIEDVLVSRSRRHEKRIPWEKVKAHLIKGGRLRG